MHSVKYECICYCVLPHMLTSVFILYVHVLYSTACVHCTHLNKMCSVVVGAMFISLDVNIAPTFYYECCTQPISIFWWVQYSHEHCTHICIWMLHPAKISFLVGAIFTSTVGAIFPGCNVPLIPIVWLRHGRSAEKGQTSEFAKCLSHKRLIGVYTCYFEVTVNYQKHNSGRIM